MVGLFRPSQLGAIAFLLLSIGMQNLGFADGCDAQCSNTAGYSDEAKAQCDAYKAAKKAETIDTVLVSIDATTEALCAAACAEIAFPVIGSFSGAACNAMSVADQTADLVGSLIQANGQFSPDLLMNIGMIGMSAYGLKNDFKAARGAAGAAPK
jgi:hypothetical protein